MTDEIGEHLAAWRAYSSTPWARIRYAIVGEVLRREADDLQSHGLGPALRVLDVGGGDGMDALPLALAGHEVTVVDPSERWLAAAQRRAAEAGAPIRVVHTGLDQLPSGEWDLVLCHFVLRYRAPQAGDLAALARRVRPGGRLSIMDVNPDGRVLRSLLNDGPSAAHAELRADRARVETFGTTSRKVAWREVQNEAETAGLRFRGLFGNRIANDLLVDDAAKHDPAHFDDLLALELELCDREPFNRIGFAWQLILERWSDGRPRRGQLGRVDAAVAGRERLGGGVAGAVLRDEQRDPRVVRPSEGELAAPDGDDDRGLLVVVRREDAVVRQLAGELIDAGGIDVVGAVGQPDGAVFEIMHDAHLGHRLVVHAALEPVRRVVASHGRRLRVVDLLADRNMLPGQAGELLDSAEVGLDLLRGRRPVRSLVRLGVRVVLGQHDRHQHGDRHRQRGGEHGEDDRQR
ncbi:methyltransferase domain-containing protein [Nocardioides albidus]|uniref:Methyltransferase domain-containing protein n=1 Tax=Nocardioides albidus TaxID=1517589 RepID=A0A5C4W732_9ACTN|nr:methyltransferase domain-containing protein [Nocardioides albidus]